VSAQLSPALAVANAGLMRLLIEGDIATMIRTLQRDASSPWQIAGIIQDVNKYLSAMTHFCISHVY